jgi:2-dehydro-3-deoxyphosphogluconate aldolase/(4S)-4-hydroxy-2-oxoglutarate aldolase
MRAVEACQIIQDRGIVPVVRARSAEEALRAADAVLEGGLDVLEITMTVPGAVDVIDALNRRFGRDVLVGAGTVLSPKVAAHCIDAGAEFIISPGLDLKIIELCHYYDKAVCPGGLSPTEIISAFQAGGHMVKVFPCSAVGGAKYLRSLRGPFPDIKLLPTGGVNLSTAEAYVAAGATALGVGSELIDPRALHDGDRATIVQRVRAFMGVVRQARDMLAGKTQSLEAPSS